jgi:CHAT domain-containing protein
MDLRGKKCALNLFLVLALAGCGRTSRPSAETLYQEAYNLLRSEHYQEASKKTEAGLQRAPPGSAWYWKFRLLKAEILLANRQIPEALAALQFQLPAGPQWTAELARYRLRQGDAASFQGNYPEAESRLAEAQKLAASVNAAGLLAEIELRQGAVAVVRERPAEAESELQEVRAYADRQGDVYLQMKVTGNIGYMLLKSARSDQAIPWFEKALAAARKLGAADSEARALGNLCASYFPLGDFDQALHYCMQADSLLERTGNLYETQRWLGIVGSIYDVARHDHGAAAATYQQALSIARTVKDRSFTAKWLNDLANVSIETGDWDAAERYNDEALRIKKELGDPVGYSLVNAALIADGRKDRPRAEEIFRSVIRSPQKDFRPLLDAHAGLAQMLAETHRDAQAESEFRAAIAVEENRLAELPKDGYKLTYFSSLIEYYQQYVDFLMARGRTGAALEAAESSRARLLADKLKLHSVRRSRTAAEFQKLAEIYHSTLLSYWLAPGKSYLWVITPAKISAVSLPPEPQIRAWVENYDGLIQNLRDPLDTENPAGRKLYEALIAPAERLMPKAGNVILAPDGPLHSLNFETLPVFEPKPHYWIQDATVSVTPSLGLLSPDRPRQATARSLLLIGNPVSPDARYPTLEFAGQEMTAIENSLPGFQIVSRHGPQAQPEAYAQADLGRFGLIHFVAHATANREEPLESAVILSRSGDNYELLAKDVIDKRLQAELVTISSCRSAGARTYAGEGLVGFSWAFLEAGARNVIAGLWDVNDRSTADLMERLYGGLFRGLAPADALRSAKLKLVEAPGAYRKPYYWGPFQVFTRSL